MNAFWKIAAVLVLVVAALNTVAMLPPETFKDPIFAAKDAEGNDGATSEHTEFA